MRGSPASLLSHRPVRVVAATAAALVAVCALHYAWRAPDRELARYLAETKAAGVTTTTGELVPPREPDSREATPLRLAPANLHCKATR